jgi:signal transduction histidine kinase
MIASPVTFTSRITAARVSILKHGLAVTGVSLLIGTLLWLARSNQRLDVQWAYSLSMGFVSWLVIDLGRFAIDRASPMNFPRGWRGVALVFGGVLTGYLIGTLIGDAYGGNSTWSLIAHNPRLFWYYLLISMLLGSAVSFFFYAVERSAHLNTQLQASQKLAALAQLQLLQSQLEPHMLFNTLANLRALIETDPPRAVSMLDRLNDFLRAALQASRSGSHTLRAEFDRLQDYLELMSVRMGPRLTYTFELPDVLAQQAVPPMLLQPLVENAIRHGLEPLRKPGSLQISATARGDMLQLEVVDNGVGLSDAAALSSGGFGLVQVRERLATLYGARASLTLSAVASGGTRSRIDMPFAP